MDGGTLGVVVAAGGGLDVEGCEFPPELEPPEFEFPPEFDPPELEPPELEPPEFEPPEFEPPGFAVGTVLEKKHNR